MAVTLDDSYLEWECLTVISKTDTFFVDSTKDSLKFVMLCNGNSCASTLLTFSTTLKMQYESMKIVSQRLFYEDHFKFFLGQKAGYMKHFVFLLLLGRQRLK